MDKFQVETAQNIQITQNIAGLGLRIGAYVIDLILLIAYEILITYLWDSFRWSSSSDFIERYVIMSSFLIPIFFYHLAMESLNNGQSVGKMILKIRVVTLDGSPARISHYLIRWLMRAFDIALSSGGLAVFVMLLNGKGQRLGDIAAKTTVISEKKRISLEDTLLMDIPMDYLPTYPQVTIFSDQEIQTIKNVFQKAKSERDDQVIEELAQKLIKVMEVNPEEQPSVFIKVVLTDYNYYTQQ